MSRPIVFVVHAGDPLLEALVEDLGRRFESDCRILSERSVAAGRSALAELAVKSEPVALLIADPAPNGGSGRTSSGTSSPGSAFPTASIQRIPRKGEP